MKIYYNIFPIEASEEKKFQSKFTDGCVRLKKDGTSYLFWEGSWSPICSHWFWDNNNGASDFCRKLGFSGGIIKDRKKVIGPYNEDAIQIGRCSAGEAIESCTGFMNDYKKTSRCSAGNPVKIVISCDGNTKNVQQEVCPGKTIIVTTFITPQKKHF